MKNLTVSRSIYALLKKEGGKVNKAVILEWDVPYDDGGERKTANKDTVARKLREMAEEGIWIGVEHRDGQSYYWTKSGDEQAKDADEQFNALARPKTALRTPHNTVIVVDDTQVETLLGRGYVKL